MSSIGAIGSGISPSALLSMIESAAASAASSTPVVANAGATGTHAVTPAAIARSADSFHLSGLGALVSQLQQFQIDHPLLFQQAMIHIAGQLNNASLQTTGNPAMYLSNLADLFQAASLSGDLSSIS